MVEFPEYQEIIDRIRASVAADLPGVDPTIFASFVRAFSDGLGGRSFDLVLLLKEILKEIFPQTSEGIYLERWGGYEDLEKNPATESSGLITFTGTVTSLIPAGTQLNTADGNLYTTDISLTLTAQSINITSLTRTGTTATATTASDHILATGQQVVMAGANETDYNGTFTIIVTAANKFTYTVSGSPTTPATGTITAAFDGGQVNITSDETGEDLNLDSGAQLSLVTPIGGVDTTAFVQFSAVGGGTDAEEDGQPGQLETGTFRTRVFNSRANPVANFNITAIEKAALSVAGVTRVKVNRITPYVGAVTVLFVRDNDDNIIPDGSEVTTVETAILELLPATSDTSDVFVTAPTAVITDFTFSSISPDTSTMRTAIENSLIAMYRNEATFETDITEAKYSAAIIDTVDLETGDSLTAFALTVPSGDITVGTDQIGVLGAVTF